ncbi:uncharacterized protein LOC115629990 [Scaptodrosophila lebanonensis]|uniref:Uncharacterized protein LOC115629990 n=1 Tax=Drosophila lebanonensis TaxID=7225 RepID=A0A6J2U1B6_DROLE|nr:uncharacterized protein LOC115629990 [Scaptodrosophila lebanonensis]
MLDVVETKIKECKETEIKTPSGNAYWKYRGLRFSTSEGVLCWKENETLLFRECNTHSGRWLPESVTCKTRDEPNTFCPNDLLEIMMRNDNPVCLKISPHPHQYDDAYCHGSNVIIPLDLSVPDSDLSIAVTKFLSSKGINRFWLPLKRNDTLPLYKVRLPGTRWSEIFEGSIEIADLRSNKNCLSTIVVHNQKNNSHQNRHTQFINEVTHCNELIHSVCIFRKKLLSRTGCKENFGALSYRPAECYGLEWNHKSRSRSINALNVNNFFEKRNVLQLIFRDLISKSRRNEFFEVESFADEADKVYVVLMNRKEEFKILHKNNDNEFPLISEEIVPITNNLVTMILKFNVELQQLVLIVYNSRFIWRIEEDDENEGVAIFQDAESQEPSEMLTGAFKHEYYRFLQANHTYEDFVNDPHLQMGTFIPDKLLNRLNEISEMLNVTQKRSPVIIIKIYSSDRLFQELSTKKQIVSGRIVSISIPGFNTELPDIVPIALHVSPDEAKNKNDSIELCHYWNFRNWVTDAT